MPSDAFQWVASSGGSWTTAASWVDESTGTTASRSPGAADSATIQGATGAHVQTLAGAGAAAEASFLGNTNISGKLAIGTLSVGSGSVLGALSAIAGATLTASTGTVVAGDLSASGSGGLIAISGVLSIGTGGQGVAGPAVGIAAANGGTLRLGALVGTGGALTVLSTSSNGVIEVGTLGNGAAGVITVDAGAQLSGNLEVNLGGDVVDNGSIVAAGGTLSIGTVGGTGMLAIDDDATLSLQGRPAAALAVSFAGTSATLQLAAEAYLPGTLTGFAGGDALDFAASDISAASWSQTAGGSGVLTLSYGGNIAAQVHLVGSYNSDVFLTSSDDAGGTDVTVAATGSSGGTAVSGGTAAPDDYAWTVPGQSGAWTTASDWTDSTTGSAALLGPGSNNAVTIDGGSAGTFQVIGGNAVVASLALIANTALVGQVATGTLALGTASSAGNLDLLDGATLSAGTAGLANGELSLDGSSTAASFTTLSLGGGQSGVGFATTTLSVTDSATLRLGALSLGGGQSNIVQTDSAGVVVVGAGAGTAGAITVAAGVDVVGNGDLNSAGVVIDLGTITASGGTLAVGAVSGAGTLAIAADASLRLDAGSTTAVTFAGNDATLELATPTRIAGTLSGDAPGDAIDILGSQITGATWQAGASADQGLLTLSYDGQTAATLALAGNYVGEVFSTASDGDGGTDILLSAAASGGGGSGSDTGADGYVWQGSGSGSWSSAANWSDETLGTTATSAPGSLASVVVSGLFGKSVMQLDGPGSAATLSLIGNVNFVGGLAVGSLSVGLGTVASALALISGERASVANLTVGDGAINLYGNGSGLVVSGELTLGTSSAGLGEPSATLQATYGATVQAGGLALAGNAVLYTDAQSSLEVGTVGGGALNALTIDGGITVSGSGSLQAAQVIDNGVLRASGGTLMVGGAVSGLGTLQIDAGATLDLAATSVTSNAITFTAPGGTLRLAAATPTGTLSGFANGDSLIIDSGSIDTASYSSVNATLGTLTLSDGGNRVGQLVLAGNYSGDYFSVESAHGVADIVLATDGSATGTSTGGTSTGGTSTGGTSTGGTSTGGTSTGGTSTGGTSTGGTSTGGTSTGGTSTGGTSTGGTSTGGTSTGGTSTGGTSTGGTSTGGTSTGGTSTGGTSTGGTSTGGTSTGGTSTGGTSTGGTSTGGTSTGGTSTGGTTVLCSTRHHSNIEQASRPGILWAWNSATPSCLAWSVSARSLPPRSRLYNRSFAPSPARSTRSTPRSGYSTRRSTSTWFTSGQPGGTTCRMGKRPG